MAALIADLSEDEANFKPAPDEFSVSEVLQHLNSSFPRSPERIRTLASGKPYRYEGARPLSGGIAEVERLPFEEVRRRFLAGEDEVLAILDAANPTIGLELTAEHNEFGPFNWLEWAVYSHHVHTHDHVGQVSRLRQEIERGRRPASG